MNAQQLTADLQWRYATKVFRKDTPIPEQDWQALLDSIYLSPSSLGMQLWQFINVQDHAVRQELRRVS